MIVCQWCGTDYEWTDSVNGALCPECRNDARQEAREAMEDAAEAEATGN